VCWKGHPSEGARATTTAGCIGHCERAGNHQPDQIAPQGSHPRLTLNICVMLRGPRGSQITQSVSLAVPPPLMLPVRG
jgi:hypothetical protein